MDNFNNVIDKLNGIKIAHRGLFDRDNPENSIGAFKKCIERKIPIELDVRMLKDNTIVVFHDNDTGRMTEKRLVLRDCVYNDIKDLKLMNSKYNICKLEDVLKLVDGKVLIDIEIKNRGNEFKICSEVSKYLDKYKGDFIIKSFNPLCVLWFRINRYNYVRGLLIPKLKDNNIVDRVKYKIIDLIVKSNFVAIDYRYESLKLSNIYKKRKIPILFYTIKERDIEKYSKCINYSNVGYIYEE